MSEPSSSVIGGDGAQGPPSGLRGAAERVPTLTRAVHFVWEPRLPESGTPVTHRERAKIRRRWAAHTNIKSIRFLRYMAVAEATAFLLLITVGVLHATVGGWGWELFVMGNVHGAIFTTYLVSITICHRRVGWGPLMLLLVLLAGFVPGGGLMVERWALAAPGRD